MNGERASRMKKRAGFSRPAPLTRMASQAKARRKTARYFFILNTSM
jgi:hypothetical protein